MTRLQFILSDLQETAVVLANLQDRISKDPDDAILRVNAETLLKRRRDLELRLFREIGGQQLDLIQYRIEQQQGKPIPATGLASAILLFQRLITAIFDALRTQPKQTYSPTAESVALSTMTLASAKMIPPVELSFAIPNDRLLALDSDLDLTFMTALNLLRSHTADALRELAGRIGVSSLSEAYRWTTNSVEHRLTSSLSWRKSAHQGFAIVVSADDALLLQTTIGLLYLERLADFDTDLELVALDEDARTFAGSTPQGQLTGSLDLRFPRGGRWVTHKRYAAALTKLTRIRCADGHEETYWTLRQLSDRT